MGYLVHDFPNPLTPWDREQMHEARDVGFGCSSRIDSDESDDDDIGNDGESCAGYAENTAGGRWNGTATTGLYLAQDSASPRGLPELVLDLSAVCRRC